jgi:hypothetical protein
VTLGVFSVQLGLFPVGGMEDAGTTATGLPTCSTRRTMALPCLVLHCAYLGEYVIVMRSSMLDTVREDYLQLARATGRRDADVRTHEAVPNALLPVVSLSALNFGFVLSGAIAVESIFSWPGLGQATPRRSAVPTSRCCRPVPVVLGTFTGPTWRSISCTANSIHEWVDDDAPTLSARSIVGRVPCGVAEWCDDPSHRIATAGLIVLVARADGAARPADRRTALRRSALDNPRGAAQRHLLLGTGPAAAWPCGSHYGSRVSLSGVDGHRARCRSAVRGHRGRVLRQGWTRS